MVEHSIHNAVVVGSIPTPGTSFMHKIFTFEGYNLNLKKGQASFNYSIENGEKLNFTEKISFPSIEANIPNDLLKSLLTNIMLILGISYWKLYCPKDIKIKDFSLSKEQADFWNIVYTKGLGEFFYKNKIDFRGLVRFPYTDRDQEKIPLFPRKERSLLGLGGGKDSIVAAELLKAQDKDFGLFTVGTSQIQNEVAKIIGKKPILIKRELDSKLLDLNREKGTYNGHIPISAIYAFLGLLASVFYDYNKIVVGNEKSANYGNVEYLGEAINHQWSKSEEFEKLFNEYVGKFITPGIAYSSPLRKMSELEVVKKFVNYPQYFKIFSSCNNNFKILKHIQNDKSLWCGKCPKCLFVFMCLAAFLSKKEVLGIFGKNLFEDKSLIPLFKELIGRKNFKPFECVGTPDEVKEALGKISAKGEFENSFLMQHLKSL